MLNVYVELFFSFVKSGVRLNFDFPQKLGESKKRNTDLV